MQLGFLITARLKSTRLPLKLLRPLEGRTLVERVIDRCKQVGYVDRIVLCTSNLPEDRPLVDIAQRNDIYYYNGDPDDVIKRLYDAARFFGFDAILSITGENPLFSIVYANETARLIRTGAYDYVQALKMPIGTAVWGLDVRAMGTVCEVKQQLDTEIWGPLIRRPELFRIHEFDAEPNLQDPTLRITSDYPEDFAFLSALFAAFPHQQVPGLVQVMDYLAAHPELRQIHANRVQASVPAEVLQKIEDFYTQNRTHVEAVKARYYAVPTA